MTSDAKGPQAVRVQFVTKRQLLDGTAYRDWAPSTSFGRVGGPYADMLMNACDPDDPVSIIVLSGSNPVGKINLLKGALVLDGCPMDLFWGSGLEVLQESRRSGAGLAIMTSLRKLSPAMGAVSISLDAMPLYTKLGWKSFSAPRYVLPRKAAPLLSWVFGQRQGVAFSMACVIAEACLRAYAHILMVMWRWSSSGFSVEESSILPESLRKELVGFTDRRFHTTRTVESVNQMLTGGPMDNGRRLHLVRDHSGEIGGYFVTSCALRESVAGGRMSGVRVASLRDWMSFDDGSLPEKALIRLGLLQLGKANADAIEICIPEHHSTSRRMFLGLLRLGEQYFVLRVNDKQTQIVESDLAKQSNWWFRPGDGDAFLL
jgi:hypothetical protein